MDKRNEEIKSEYDKIKAENNYVEGTTKQEAKSEKDLFRVLVEENGLVKQIITTND